MQTQSPIIGPFPAKFLKSLPWTEPSHGNMGAEGGHWATWLYPSFREEEPRRNH